MATHSSVLAWRITGTAEPGGRPSMGSHRVGHDWSDLAAAAARIYWLLTYLANLPRRGTGHSVMYRKKWVIIMDLTLQSRGDINHLPLAIHQFQASAVTIGEGPGWPWQNRADSSYKAFSSPTHHIEGDLRLCWSDEDGSSGMWSWALSDNMWAGTSRLRHSQGVAPPASHRRVLRIFPLPVPTFPTEGTLLQTRQLLGGLSSLLSPPDSPRGGGWIRAANSCLFFIG